MTRILDDITDVQDAIIVLEKVKLDSPLYDEEYSKKNRQSKFRVLQDLYDQLEAHIEHDVLLYTKSEIKKLYHQRFIDEYDILNKAGSE